LPSGRQDSGIAAVTAQLTQTQGLIQNLLAEIHKSSASQAALKAELKQLRYNVQLLSNIIRGGDGHNKPLLSEVEVLKHADSHLERRMTKVVQDMESQMDELGNAFSSIEDGLKESIASQRASLEGKISEADRNRRDNDTQRMELQLLDTKDLRLDKRQRFQTLATIAIAVLSLIGTTIALFVKG
jgi:septal ring factor EnvC (AmiA/AmiB activator)